MSALSTLGQRQQSMLTTLLHNRQGLTVDALASELKISRNAVNQHLINLDSSGFIENVAMTSTGGRPSKLYTLSAKGLELFPRHYALFSNLLIHWIKQKLDDSELQSCMDELGEQIAQEFEVRVRKHSDQKDKIFEVAKIMHELGYDAEAEVTQDKSVEIVASNCVFHKLADDCNEVCRLDLSLLSNLLGSEINHKECMVKGGQCCRFSVDN